ncbi:hypothetical protein C3B44_00205 [Corynebacterium yudongzhengii]|uniref:DUF2178 domain-containing protein n=1 Tax=Corynebacterium yudongzhengii TaxID=2080740 RepID=A0A2U1T536_9CORY|nr:hypothetical protein [Corynebacterium yudongzhengii]AWB80965.1 hypothetical protein C3B44_00205 [Corynebacterium yudongzhengii]PWC01109.1 hypothetical protein DF222_09040 [Corynebacterium yudongzhengii]
MKTRKIAAISAAAVAWLVLIGATLATAFGSIIWWVALVVFILCWLITRSATRDIAETQSGYLDEYERSLKSRAFTAGFWVAIGAGVVLMVFLAVIGQSGGVWAEDVLQSVWQLILAVHLLIAATPTFWLGWITRETPQE